MNPVGRMCNVVAALLLMISMIPLPIPGLGNMFGITTASVELHTCDLGESGKHEER